MPRVVHFEVDAKKPERAAKFYEEVFGWKVDKWNGPTEYWLITSGKEGEPGIDGGLSRRSEATPSTVNTIDVPSVDEFTKKVESKGGTIVRPKIAVPGVGWMATSKIPKEQFGV